MPTYEYLCQSCGQGHEIFQKITEEPIKECPSCHKPTLVKQLSATNFQLKGSGWYVTDIRDKDKKKPVESEPAKPAATTETPKTDTTKTTETKSSDSSTKSGTSST